MDWRRTDQRSPRYLPTRPRSRADGLRSVSVAWGAGTTFKWSLRAVELYHCMRIPAGELKGCAAPASRILEGNLQEAPPPRRSDVAWTMFRFLQSRVLPAYQTSRPNTSTNSLEAPASALNTKGLGTEVFGQPLWRVESFQGNLGPVMDVFFLVFCQGPGGVSSRVPRFPQDFLWCMFLGC